MAEKKKQPKADNKSATAGELATQLRQALEKRAKLEFQHSVTPLKNPLEIRYVRRDIARLKTQLRTKEAAK